MAKKREDRTPAYWAGIPAPVRYDKSLRPNAKLLYADINSLADRKGYCWASNEYLGSNLGIAARTVSDLVGTLAERKHITVEVLRDPKTNEVIERRIWIAKPVLMNDNDDDGPACDPPAKNGDTPPADFSGTPPAKNGYKNNLKEIDSNNPLTPKGGRRRKSTKGPKAAPDWKPERFAAFWDYYRTKGRGEDKQAAIRAWDRLQPSDQLIVTMGKALQQQVSGENWQRGIGIPYASTWLNNARWEDTPKAPVVYGPPADGPHSQRRVVESEGVKEW